MTMITTEWMPLFAARMRVLTFFLRTVDEDTWNEREATGQGTNEELRGRNDAIYLMLLNDLDSATRRPRCHFKTVVRLEHLR